MFEAITKKSQHFKGQNGEDLSFCEPEILEEYAKLPLETVTMSNLNFPANSEIVIVLGGETHGLSLMARKLALDNFGASVYIPLRNQIDSLNVACAASIILYQFLENLTIRIAILIVDLTQSKFSDQSFAKWTRV